MITDTILFGDCQDTLNNFDEQIQQGCVLHVHNSYGLSTRL